MVGPSFAGREKPPLVDADMSGAIVALADLTGAALAQLVRMDRNPRTPTTRTDMVRVTRNTSPGPSETQRSGSGMIAGMIAAMDLARSSIVKALLVTATALQIGGCGEESAPDGTGGTERTGGGTEGDAAVRAEPQCVGHVDCDDGLFCTGTELCEDGQCMPGTPVVCDDGVDCTVDRCDDDTEACSLLPPDQDGDGHYDIACLDASGESLGTDCDDLDAESFPGNPEICDDANRDEDCDPTTFGARDGDDDGYVDAVCCNADASGTLHCGDDCADDEPGRHPTVPEVCDGIDNDCSGTVDEGLLLDGFRDTDSDGYGDVDGAQQRCPGTANFVVTPGDCNDLELSISPAAAETCDGIDNDCDGTVDEGLLLVGFRDIDGDGYGDKSLPRTDCLGTAGLVANDADCDDTEAGISPEAAEACDGVDNDCDDGVDEGLIVGGFRDIDGDGYGDINLPRSECEGVMGIVDNSLDCNDMAPAISPAAVETCDGADNDCNGSIDEGTLLLGYADLDGDLFGDPDAPIERCAPGAGFSQVGTDCDDADARVYGGRDELCDGKDNDCDSSIDEELLLDGFADLDGDLHGDPDAPVRVCVGAPRFSYIGDDCDDANNRVHGAQVEVCDGVDNDCDGIVDENAVAVTWYLDDDDDGFGNAGGGTLVQCSPPAGYSLHATDCDDSSSGISPLGIEACDGLDNDCNGLADFEVAPGNYEDDDADGYTDAACALVGEDCDDDNPSIHPGAPAVCDGRDSDCDGTVDDGEEVLWYRDLDNDNFGDDADSELSCVPLLGFVLQGGDCDDSTRDLNPGRFDGCDGVDNDCDGNTDEGAVFFEAYLDTDGDGAGTGAAVMMCSLAEDHGLLPNDCEADDPLIFDGQDELCDNVDNDCDNNTDEDADRECNLSEAVSSCSAGTCGVDSCLNDYGNCDSLAHNGCEADLMTDILNCGSCGDPCDIGPNASGYCLDGACEMTCATNWVNCDGYLNTGCEAMLAQDPQNCGGCGLRCSERDNAAAACVDSICEVTCTEGYTSCDSDELTGCEIHTANDSNNCGSCSNVCNPDEICGDGDCLVPPYGGGGADGDFMPVTDVTLDSGVHEFGSIYIPAGVTLTITGGDVGFLDLRATGDVVIDGTIDLSGGKGGNGGAASAGAARLSGGGGATGDPLGVGPNGSDMCPVAAVGGYGSAGLDGTADPTSVLCGIGGANGGGAGGGKSNSGGGGGGGFAGGGGGGGSLNDSLGDGASSPGLTVGGQAGALATGGQGGEPGLQVYGGGTALDCTGSVRAGGGGGGSIGAVAAADTAADDTFLTGSAGGGGGTNSYYGGGGGGGGGGALRIAAAGTIEIGSTGRLLANGGAGGIAGNATGGGGGGGSGGLIYLSAPTFINAGIVEARGGLGGVLSGSCSNGASGGAGRIRLSLLPVQCTVLGSFDPPIEGGCVITGSFAPGTTYVGLYPY